VIIESLPSAERQTGAELYNHLAGQSDIRVVVTLERPRTADELFSALDQAALRAQAGSWVPLVHFEMHGTTERDAVVTASGERVKWNDVAEPLRHINIAVQNALIVVLGVCSGAFIGVAAANNPLEPAPFAWLVGPDRPVSEFFLPVGFKALYAELLATGNFAKAVIELRQRTLPEYTAFDTAQLFRRGCESYDRTQTRGPVLAQRVKRIFRQRRSALVAEYGSNNKARAAVAREIQESSSERWREYYRRFIMADRYPENEERFPPITGA
jgi:hypothetical protein